MDSNFFPPGDLTPDDIAGLSHERSLDVQPIPDEQLVVWVAWRLDDAISSPDHRIVVEVQNQVVMLEGIVPSAGVRRRAHQVVWDTPGVVDVSNRLVVDLDD